jgi:TPR repeat protein
MRLCPLMVSAAFSIFVLASVHADDRAVTADMVYNRDNLARLEPLALKGNATAAMTLFAYYSFYHRPRASEDDVIARKWLNVAVDDGDPEAMLELASIMQHKGGAPNCAKAVTLVRKALTLNSEERFSRRAQSYLDDFKKSADCAGLM